jgi:hypothetical protein
MNLKIYERTNDMSDRAVWYRAVSTNNPWAKFNENPVRIQLLEYPVIRFTPAGAWLMIDIGERFVLARGNKVFARAKKEDAVNDLRHRYIRRVKILAAQLNSTKLTLEKLDDRST